MKKLLVISLIALAMVGCEQPLDEQEQNQPVNPATFSLVGKKYVCDRSEDNPYNEPYFMEVFDFFSMDSAVWYGTTHRDLSPMEDYYNPCQYKLEFPKLVLTFGIDERTLIFQDTTKFYWEPYYYVILR